jgi:hypothetical protein
MVKSPSFTINTLKRQEVLQKRKLLLDLKDWTKFTTPMKSKQKSNEVFFNAFLCFPE